MEREGLVLDILKNIQMQNGNSVYTEISKKVGWESSPIILPRKEFGMALLKAVKSGNLNAFEAVVRYYRFGLSPQSKTENESLTLIYEAFEAGKQLFENVPA